MPDKTLPSGSPLPRKKYTPAFKAECVRQVAVGPGKRTWLAPKASHPPCWAAGSARR